MKKTLLSLAAMLLCLCAFADDLSITGGSSSILLSKGATANLTINYDNASVGSIDYCKLSDAVALPEYLASKGEEYVRDWPSIRDNGTAVFVAMFNKTFKKGLNITGAPDAPYEIKLNITGIDFGNSSGAFVGMYAKAGGAAIIGTFDVIEKASGNVVLSVELQEVKGPASFTENLRFQSMFSTLCKDLKGISKK